MKRISLVRVLNRMGIFNWVRWVRSRTHACDRHKLSFYGQFVRKGELCFDIGANIGQKVELFLKLGARVVAVEPQQSCFNFLKKVYGNNDHVVLVNKAVGTVAGEQELIICEANAMSSLSPEWVLKAKEIWKDHQWTKKEIVGMETLDALIERFGSPKFIKIDVEGFEIDVIKGLTRSVPFLSFELTPITSPRLNEVYDHLKNLGDLSFNLVGDPTFFNGPINFVFNRWVKWDELSLYASNHRENLFCDIFVKFDCRNKP